jgi:biopolymer transport protein ExbD
MRLGRTRRRKGDDFAKPQMTSLVDVLTVLVFFLLKNFSSEGDIVTPSKNLELPVSSSKAKPEQMLNIAISSKHILVEGTPVAVVTEEQERPSRSRNTTRTFPSTASWSSRGTGSFPIGCCRRCSRRAATTVTAAIPSR